MDPERNSQSISKYKQKLKMTQETISQNLYTKYIPDPDILIRTEILID